MIYKTDQLFSDFTTHNAYYVTKILQASREYIMVLYWKSFSSLLKKKEICRELDFLLWAFSVDS